MKKKLLTFSVLPLISLAPVALAVSCSQQSRIKQKEQRIKQKEQRIKQKEQRFIDLTVNKATAEGLKLAGIDKNSPEGKKAIEEAKKINEGIAKSALDVIKQNAKSDDEYEKALDEAIKVLEQFHL
ncbi:hypothetical protein [Mycoplasmopsis opalescens]|uniref:hypothetical protein n=1 Tax=Mycoplasmopsis opalescens TaxID=114886 RepID=UPI0004A6F9A8|nr:hypothetical protein [Mycoplasmopsis opalescens]